MSEQKIEAPAWPRLDHLHRLLLPGISLALAAALIHTAAGAAGLGLALVAVALRLALPPRLIARFYPHFRKARPVAPDLDPRARAALGALIDRAGLTAAPALLVNDRPGLGAHSLATPFGAAIVLDQGAVEGLEARELTAIVAHELSHVGKGDGWLAWSLNAAAVIALACTAGGVLLGWLGFTPALEGWLAAAVVVLSLLPLLLNVVVMQALERDADRTAAALTGDPDGLAAALDKQASPAAAGFAWIFDMHPPVGRRIARLDRRACAERRLRGPGF